MEQFGIAFIITPLFVLYFKLSLYVEIYLTKQDLQIKKKIMAFVV